MSKDKDEMRKRLSSLSFTEKIKILEKLRDRSLMLAASGLRQGRSTEHTQARQQKSTDVTKEG